MYVVKIDKNEYTENGQKHEVWGYAIYNNTECVKKEVIKARAKENDTRVMRYVRCYQWALQRVVGYFNVTPLASDEINIYFTNYNVIQWLESGDINKLYRLSMSKVTGYIDELPHSTVKLCPAESSWGFRKTLKIETVPRNAGYSKLTDFIKTITEA